MNTTAVIIDEDAKRKANIRVLQRIDANINDVLGSATHVVLYEFRAASQSWEKKDCEGAVFVCKASGVPRFRMIILNRVASDNLVVNITEKFQLQDR
jgi:mRNA-decapping enzyme 1B